MEEIWKDIDDNYRVSNTGKIYSFFSNKLLKLCKHSKGYLVVAMYGKRLKVHRLVAQAFIANPLDLPQVNHKDGDKTNNNDWNLEWCTSSQNVQHAFDTGLKMPTKGIGHGMTKLTEAQVLEIRQLKGKLMGIEIAKQYNITPQMVSYILNNHNWKHL